MFLLCCFLCLCLRLHIGTMSRCRHSLKMGSCTQYRGDFVLLFVFVCFFFVSVFVPAPKWVHALSTEETLCLCLCLSVSLSFLYLSSSQHQNGFMHSLQRRDGFIRSRPQDPSPLNKLHCGALQWNYYCMKLTTSQWKRAWDQSLLDVAQCNFSCKEQNKARWKRAQVYGTNKSTALQEVHVHAYMYIHMWVFLFVCACVCTRSVLKART